MFRPGDIIVVTGPSKAHPERKPGFVTVRENYGSIQGHGWLIHTKEGNILLVKDAENYIAHVLFVTHPAHISALLWLVNHPERLNDLPGFIQFCKQSKDVQALLAYHAKASAKAHKPDPTD